MGGRRCRPTRPSLTQTLFTSTLAPRINRRWRRDLYRAALPSCRPSCQLRRYRGKPSCSSSRQLGPRRRLCSYFRLGSKHWSRIKGSISNHSRKVGRAAPGSILFYDFNLFRPRAAKMGVSFHLIPSVKIGWARWKFRQQPAGQQIGTWRNGLHAKWALQKLYISAAARLFQFSETENNGRTGAAETRSERSRIQSRIEPPPPPPDGPSGLPSKASQDPTQMTSDWE